jgi:predicted Zn-dependent protease
MVQRISQTETTVRSQPESRPSSNSAPISTQGSSTASLAAPTFQNTLQNELFQQALPKSPIHNVYIGSYGNVSTSTLRQVQNIIRASIGVKTTILQRSSEPFPEKPPFYDSTRQQYDADYIWQALISLEQQYGPLVRILTVVDVDLFTNVQSSGTEQYVLSRALPNVNAAVISLYRIKRLSDSSSAPAPQDLIDNRLKKLVLRTLGVTVGFSLSPSANDISCVMYPALNLSDLDRKGDQFCAAEAALVNKVFQSTTQ